jgi:hypothetical protein
VTCPICGRVEATEDNGSETDICARAFTHPNAGERAYCYRIGYEREKARADATEERAERAEESLRMQHVNYLDQVGK